MKVAALNNRLSVDEMAFCWKMPSRTSIAPEEKLVLDFRASKDGLPLFLGWRS